MRNKRFLSLAFILGTVIIMFLAFSYMISNGGTNSPEGSNSGNVVLTNNIENNVNNDRHDDVEINNNVNNDGDGESAEITNSIHNNVENAHNNQIDNSIHNNINVNVNIIVSNDINNEVKNDELTEEQPGNDESKEENNDQENSNGNNNGESDHDEELVWGVDSASLTTENMLACVEGNFGSPEVWGRYLGDKEDVSRGLTSDEIDLLHANEIKILLIWNRFTDGTGYDHGQNQAEEAVAMAEDIGVPEEVAIFANVEPIYPIEAAFIQGWYDAMIDSGYSPGVYGVFDSEEELYTSFKQAGEGNSEIMENTLVWTAAPNIGITTEANAPEYEPDAPENALVAGWQYGLDAKTCNIDTNLFDSDILDHLW